MKKVFLFLLTTLFLLPSCGGNKEVPELPPPSGYEEEQETPSEEEEPDVRHDPFVLGSEWSQLAVSEGLKYYSYNQKDPVSNAQQIVNVVDLDLTNPRYKVLFSWTSGGIITSELMKSKGAVVAMNGGYELSSIVVEINGSMISLMPGNYVGSTTVPNWKSEAAVYTDGERDVQIEFSGKGKSLTQQRAFYMSDKRKYTISSAPMLIDNYDPVGTTFAKANVNVNSLNYEDPDRHQGVRHPRTAVALTADKHFLMITVDGRRTGISEGMSAKELTNFLVKHFDPQYALNMDGGGSTTLCVKGQGDANTNVVNYPTDNSQFDHSGERTVSTHFYILDTK